MTNNNSSENVSSKAGLELESATNDLGIATEELNKTITFAYGFMKGMSEVADASSLGAMMRILNTQNEHNTEEEM